MTDIYTWSTTAGDNDDADSGINWAEFQDPDTVNNSARTMMARIASLRDDLLPKRTSAGSTNAYTVTAAAAPSSYASDFVIWFVADKTNSGTATLAPNALAAKPLRAKASTALAAGEIQANTIVGAYYRSATDEFLIVNSGFHANALLPSVASAYAVGMKAGMSAVWRGYSLPAGFLWEDGSAVLRASYPEMATNLYCGDSLNATAPHGYRATTNVNPSANRSTSGNYIVLPDSRGKADFGRTDMGGSDAANITSAGSGIVGTTLGATGGAQTVTLTALNMPNMSISISDPGHGHVYVRYQQLAVVDFGSGATQTWRTPGNESTTSSTTGITASINTDARGGAQTAVNKMPPALICNKIILALPAAANAAALGTNGVPYTFDSATSAADPGAGKLRLNNAALASATAMYISETGANAEPLGPYISTWDDSPTSTKGELYIYKIGAVGTFAIFQISGSNTDNGDYQTVNVTHVTGNGTFSDGDRLSVLFYRTANTNIAPTYTVAGLPAVATAGQFAFASNGRKNGEGGGLGTGVICFYDGTAWRACDTGATVAA
jgi:hypothetical protein